MAHGPTVSQSLAIYPIVPIRSPFYYLMQYNMYHDTHGMIFDILLDAIQYVSWYTWNDIWYVSMTHFLTLAQKPVELKKLWNQYFGLYMIRLQQAFVFLHTWSNFNYSLKRKEIL